MGRYTWGVDGNGICHCVDPDNNVLFCAFNSGGASVFCKEVDMKKPLSIKEDSVFKVIFRNTEYVFDNIEEAKLFELGFNDATKDRLERADQSKSYMHGYQVGSNFRGNK